MKHFKNVDFPSIHIQLINTQNQNDMSTVDTFLKQYSNTPSEKLVEMHNDMPTSSQHSLYGIFENESLIGVINWFEDYPAKEIGTIEQFTLATEYKETDLATQLYRALEKTAQDTGMTSIRVPLTENNSEMREFWMNQGLDDLDSKFEKSL